MDIDYLCQIALVLISLTAVITLCVIVDTDDCWWLLSDIVGAD